MSKADLGYTFFYKGPKKIKIPPFMSNVFKGINSATLREAMLNLKEEQILSIVAEDGGMPNKEVAEKLTDEKSEKSGGEEKE